MTYSTATIGRNAQKFINSTLIGGENRDGIYGIEKDQEGNTLIVGGTTSSDFPLHNPYQSFNAGGFIESTELYHYSYNFGDGFISKISPANTIEWSTYLGGSNIDLIRDICIDSKGDIYVIGDTRSIDFPITEDALQKNMAEETWMGLSRFSLQKEI